MLSLLQALVSSIPRRRRSRSSRRPRHSDGPEGEDMLALLWEGLCQTIEEKAPWLFTVANVLFYVALGAAFWLLWRLVS